MVLEQTHFDYVLIFAVWSIDLCLSWIEDSLLLYLIYLMALTMHTGKYAWEFFLQFLARFSDPDRSLSHKKETFKGFEVELVSNRDNVIINLIIILNIYKNIKLIKK